MIANLIGAGVGAILPVIMEAMRSKPNPEAAKEMLRSQRQARVEEAIGAGMNMQQAEKQVDAQLEQEFKQADEAGEFNTPWGEMVAGAVLGGAVPWAAGKVAGMAKGAAGKAGALMAGGKAAAGAKFAKGAPTPDVSKEAKIDTPAEQAIAKPASGQAPSAPKPDMVSPEELAPVQMRAEAMSRMHPSAMDIRNTRMLNGVPAPQRDKVLSPDELDAMISSVERKPMASPFPAKAMSASDDIAAQLESRAGYDAKRMSLDNTDPSLVSAVDDMVPASRPQGPFPEFLPGEFQSKTPSASLRPWESMPEVEGAMIRKQLGKRKADTRGIVNFMPPEGGPFPSPEAARAYSSMYRYEGG